MAHEGERLEGLGRHYNSSRRKVQWGHRLLTSALVYPGKDAYVLGAEPLLSEAMQRLRSLSVERVKRL